MLSHVVGHVLVGDEELRDRARQPDDQSVKFRESVEKLISGKRAEKNITLDFLGGRAAVGDVVPFQPVGIGKPASIMLRHVYTGRHGKDDMLLTSAIRDPFTTFNQAPRAINLMPKRVPRRTHLTGPAATESGTELVYYSPALTAQSLALTFDMAFDDYPDELIDRIAGAISTAGGVPVFGPYSGILLAVGSAIKLVSKLANALVDSRPEFAITERLDFQIPGSPVPDAGFKVLHSSAFDSTSFEFRINEGLVHKDTKRRYDGDEPYVVFALDGGKNDSFKNFTPTAASAALLSRFLSQKEGSEVAIDAIVDAFKLYNDVRHRREADRLQKQIDALPEGSSEIKELEDRRKALIANILEELLKP